VPMPRPANSCVISPAGKNSNVSPINENGAYNAACAGPISGAMTYPSNWRKTLAIEVSLPIP
jgi:hypothetical protein